MISWKFVLLIRVGLLCIYVQNICSSTVLTVTMSEGLNEGLPLLPSMRFYSHNIYLFKILSLQDIYQGKTVAAYLKMIFKWTFLCGPVTILVKLFVPTCLTQFIKQTFLPKGQFEHKLNPTCVLPITFRNKCCKFL